MAFHVYDTLTHAKREFVPLEPGKVRMYNCGPTVYDRIHIGNLRSFLFADVLRRWLEYQGYEVLQVMNITDVGHVQNDADEGADKLEERARSEGADPWEISRRCTEQFFADMQALNTLPAHVYPRATDHIPEMLEITRGLIEKGHAYQVGENVYFDVTSFARYGRLSGNRVEDLDAGARIAVHEDKRHPADFALWKSDPLHVMKWDSPFGPDGFPGWHIECSAMARAHLGDSIDIHTGGEDNVFPHHECEIAQSESFTGQPFAGYWMHARFLQVDGGKMGKSLGNFYTLDDVAEHGFEPRVLRFTLIRGHYRQPLNFTWDIMAESRAALAKLDDLVLRLRRAADGAEPDPEAALAGEARASFEAALEDDLGVPAALAALFTLRDRVLKDEPAPGAAAAALAFLERANSVLGVIDLEEQGLDDGVESLIEARNAARAARDFAESDRIRDELLERGIVLEDGPSGTTWRRTS
jgi:cysteinyl-tRNA synthetase